MFHLLVTTPEQVFFDGEIHSMNVPGKAGYFEVLQNHAPIIAELGHGELSIVDKNSKKRSWRISGGLVQVQHNQATILADS